MNIGICTREAARCEDTQSVYWVRNLADVLTRYNDLSRRLGEELGWGDNCGTLEKDCSFSILEDLRTHVQALNGRLPGSFLISRNSYTSGRIVRGEERYYLPHDHEICRIYQPACLESIAELVSADSAVPSFKRDRSGAVDCSSDFYKFFHPLGEAFVGFCRLRGLLESAGGSRLPSFLVFQPVSGIENRSAPADGHMSFREIFQLLDACLPYLDAHGMTAQSELRAAIRRKVDAFNEVNAARRSNYGREIRELLCEFIEGLCPCSKSRMFSRLDFKVDGVFFSLRVESMRLLRSVSARPGGRGGRWSRLIDRVHLKDAPVSSWIDVAPCVLREVSASLDPRHAQAIDRIVAATTGRNRESIAIPGN